MRDLHVISDWQYPGIIVMCLVLLCACCASARYSVVLRNGTTEMIDDVRVLWDGYVSTAGLVSPGSGKMEAFPDAPFPRVASVEWSTPDGINHGVDVDLREVSKRSGRLSRVDIVFTIRGDGTVGVSIEKE